MEQWRDRGRRCGPSPRRVDAPGKSGRRSDAAPRASGKRTPRPPGDGGAPLPGIRTRRQELADRRGWSTFSKARPVLVAETPLRGAPWVAARYLPIARRNGAFVRRPTGVVCARAHTGALASSSVCRRSAPLDWERRNCNCDEGSPGADQRIRAMAHACSSFRGASQDARHARLRRAIERTRGIHTSQHQKGNERRCHTLQLRGHRIPGPALRARPGMTSSAPFLRVPRIHPFRFCALSSRARSRARSRAIRNGTTS